MLLDGGKIKDAKVKLLLSSRTEMQKVIELARQQALTLQNLMQSMAAASTFGASPLSMLPNVLTGMSSVLPNLSSLPSVVASSGNTASSLTIPAPPTSQELKELKSGTPTNSKTNASSAKSANKSSDGKSSSSKTENKTGSNSRSRSRSVSKSRSRSRSHSRSRSRDRRYRDKYRYGSGGGGGGGGRSRDKRWRRDRSRSKDRSRSRDKYKRRSRSKDRRSRDRSGDMYKYRDKRRTYDKKEKSPTNDDKDRNKSRRNSDSKSKPVGIDVAEMRQHKNEITFLKVSPVRDAKTAGANELLANDSVSSIVAQILAKTKAATASHETNSVSGNDSTKTESTPNAVKIDFAPQKSWLGGVPMPPMIPSWMVSQTASTNEAAVAETEANKKPVATSEAAAKSNESKAPEPSALTMPPFGMFPSQFPFGAGFPPPPSMYPFAGYPTTAPASGPVAMSAAYVRGAVDQASPMNAAGTPSMPMPMPFYNPYQRAAAVGTESSNQSSKTPHSGDADKQGPPPKLPRLENNDETKTDRNDYNYGDFDDYKKSTTDVRTNNYSYYDDGAGDTTRNYNNGNHNGRRVDHFNSYDNNSYPYSGGRNNVYDDATTNRRPYQRRNFSSTRDDANETNQDQFDRKGNFEFKNNSNFSTACSKSSCVQVENLPADTVVDDLKRFFTPLPLYEPLIKFQFDGKDSGTRNAFVKFSCLGHKLQAMKYTGKILRGYRISVSDVESAAWEAAEDDMIASVDQQFLKVSFIPKRAKKHHLLDEFRNSPDDLILMKDRNKDSLVAYVKFADSVMVKNTLADRNKIMICDSRVKLEPISEEDFLVARADYQMSDDNLDDDVDSQTNEESVDNVKVESNKENSSLHGANTEIEEYEPTSTEEMKSTCVLMKNLPSPVTDIDIVNFFSDINVLPSQIHIMFDTNYKQTGDSFCEFGSEADAAEAISKKNRAKMKYKSVTITMVPKEQVLEVIGNQLPDEKYSNARYNNLPPLNQKPYSPRFTAPVYGSAGPRPFPPRGPPVPARQSMGPENFGKPGCVVSLENVPYKAEVDEILQFFSQFNVQRENVIRRFNENGLATGDARVCLKSPLEAEKAVQHLDGKGIRGRSIFVRLVQ